MTFETFDELSDLEAALSMAIHVTEVMIKDTKEFTSIERATMKEQVNNWQGLLGRIEKELGDKHEAAINS